MVMGHSYEFISFAHVKRTALEQEQQLVALVQHSESTLSLPQDVNRLRRKAHRRSASSQQDGESQG